MERVEEKEDSKVTRKFKATRKMELILIKKNKKIMIIESKKNLQFEK